MKKISFLILLALTTFQSCRKDFIVEDIKNKSITINAPTNNLVTSSNAITFWWEPLEGAEKYNLQIVKPNFTSIGQLVADTNVTGTKFQMSLSPGSYQWRLKATNAGGSTAFQTFNLTIDSTSNLSNQLVLPVSPLNGFITKEKTIAFSWNSLSAADSYSIEISLNSSVINYSIVTANTYNYTFTLTSAANYTCSWRVKAIIANSISQFNTPQTFTIDLLPPSAVSTPTSPTSNPIIKDTTELSWNRSSAEASYDSLFIYTDAALTNVVRTTSVSINKIRINEINAGNPLPAGTTSINAIPYWWRLKSVDNVGNTTGFSTALNFQLIQ